MNPNTVLVTGFDPFGGQPVNPSWMAVSRLPDTLAGCRVEKRLLPVIWYRALDELAKMVDEVRPGLLLCCGQAGSANRLRLERVGVNLCEAGIGDNEGLVLSGKPVVEGGPAAYFSTFPHEAMLEALKAKGIPAAYSYSAGCYLCNHVLYGGLHLAATRYPGMMAGFIHVPFLPEQAVEQPNACSMALSTIVDGLTVAIEAACRT